MEKQDLIGLHTVNPWYILATYKNQCSFRVLFICALTSLLCVYSFRTSNTAKTVQHMSDLISFWIISKWSDLNTEINDMWQ